MKSTTAINLESKKCIKREKGDTNGTRNEEILYGETRHRRLINGSLPDADLDDVLGEFHCKIDRKGKRSHPNKHLS